MIVRFALLLASTAFFVLVQATQIQAQPACGDRNMMVEKLSRDYGEARKGAGLVGRTAFFEVWASEVTGTWTILKTLPDGRACIVATGVDWQSYDPVIGDPV